MVDLPTDRPPVALEIRPPGPVDMFVEGAADKGMPVMRILAPAHVPKVLAFVLGRRCYMIAFQTFLELIQVFCFVQK
jgi:hypothetical protein